MYKVVINGCYGGFSLSEEAVKYLNDKYDMGINSKYGYLDDEFTRHDKRLVEVVEVLGEESASGDCARLHIAYIDTPLYRIDEYDGYESIEVPESPSWVVIGESDV